MFVIFSYCDLGGGKPQGKEQSWFVVFIAVDNFLAGHTFKRIVDTGNLAAGEVHQLLGAAHYEAVTCQS